MKKTIQNSRELLSLVINQLLRSILEVKFWSVHLDTLENGHEVKHEKEYHLKAAILRPIRENFGWF